MKRVSSDIAWILTTIVTMLAVPIASYADGIPPAKVLLSAGDTSSDTFGDLDYTHNSDLGTATSVASASYAGSTASALSAYAISPAVTDAPAAGSGVTLTYYFEVVPIVPVLTTNVPFVFLFDEQTSANCLTPEVCANSWGYTSVEISGGTPATVDIQQAQCTSAPGIVYFPNATCFPSSVLIDSPTKVEGYGDVGDVYEIYLQVSAYADAGVAFASIDPQIFIDPSFPDAADFTLEVSPFTPPNPAPEPSTSWLLGTALLALLGAGMRKRPHAKPG